jgi:hypothetical protein
MLSLECASHTSQLVQVVITVLRCSSRNSDVLSYRIYVVLFIEWNIRVMIALTQFWLAGTSAFFSTRGSNSTAGSVTYELVARTIMAAQTCQGGDWLALQESQNFH